MLCERCHDPVRPVVALDIDGTLGDYHGHLINFAYDYLGRGFGPVELYDGSENFGDWICRAWEIDRRTYRDIKLAYRQGAQKRSMPCYAWARELAAKIRAEGADLWLTTSRPYLRLDNVDPDTRAWLERNRIGYDHLLYDEDKYAVLASQVDSRRVCAVLDDLASMYAAAEFEFGEGVAILRRTRWNAAVGQRYRVALDLVAAIRLISDRIEAWKINNEQPQTAA